jgi:glycosyltransferase involved in cell wall biosynthesis
VEQARLPVVVIPCFDEEHRLDTARLAELAESGRVRLLMVDDGSTDRTLSMLRALAESASGVDVLDLPHNVGKAETVRLGLLQAVESGAATVGYYDADLATPPHELLRLLDVLDDRPEISFVMGARVALLGRTIERSALRHYLGRVFASLASIILRLRVYDTQCGAKVVRVTPALVEAINRPFRSSWVFDVELIARLLHGSRSVDPVPATAFEEVPLREWHDVGGSKLTVPRMVRAMTDLLVVGVQLSLRRRP